MSIKQYVEPTSSQTSVLAAVGKGQITLTF